MLHEMNPFYNLTRLYRSWGQLNFQPHFEIAIRVTPIHASKRGRIKPMILPLHDRATIQIEVVVIALCHDTLAARRSQGAERHSSSYRSYCITCIMN